MTLTKSKQRISDFQRHVNDHAADLRMMAQSSWDKVDFSASEPRIVSEFLSGRGVGTNYLNTHLAPLLSDDGRVVKFASIFLHQKPMVRGWMDAIGAKVRGRCELGDLQMVFLYLAADKTVLQSRSIVFQAKKNTARGPHVIDHPDQRELYDHCIGFTYDTVLPRERRRFPVGLPRERALQYLFMGGQPVQARTIPADDQQGAFLDFGEMLVRLLNDSTGLDFGDESPDSGGWDQIVWDLLRQIAPTMTQGEPRSSGLTELLREFNAFEDKAHYFKDVRPGGEVGGEPEGFGTILVITSDSEIAGRVVQAKQPIDPDEGDVLRDSMHGAVREDQEFPKNLRRPGEAGGAMLEA